MSQIKLIVGLGNPGQAYEDTRHNAGFWFIDLIAKKYQANLSMESKFFGFIGKFRFQGEDIYLLKPQTYMNLSGKAILALAQFYKITPGQILIAHDELDFAPGIIKLKLGGGAAGHNGLKDTERVIGRDYWRLRIGIGHPGDKNKVADYVLKKPRLEERIDIDNALDRAVAILEQFIGGDKNTAMKTLHTK